MPWALLADLVALAHLGFVLFAVVGGLLVLKWPRAAWAHLPCAAWAAAIELMAWPCPLTPLENLLLRLSGESGYAGGFLEHYLFAALYPAGLTRAHQAVLGLFVLAVNGAVYAWAWRGRGRGRGRPVQ